MILDKYEGITKLLVKNNLYPFVDNEMSFRDIFRQSIIDYYSDKSENRWELNYNVIFLADKNKSKVLHSMFLVVLKDKNTNEYIVFTVTYITNNKNYYSYKFDILDKEVNYGN